MATPVHQATVSHTGNPTTAPSTTLGTTAANDILIAVVVSGGSNTTPTLGGTYNGGAWSLIDNGQLTTTGNVAVYWSRCTGNHSGQTVNSTTVDSGSLLVSRYNSVLSTATPIGANKSESVTTNAANPGLSAFTTLGTNSKVVLAVGMDDNTTNISAATMNGNAMSLRGNPVSSGGADSGVGLLDRDQAAAGTTGAFATTWTASAAGTSKYLLAFELLQAVATLERAAAADAVGAVTVAGQRALLRQAVANAAAAITVAGVVVPGTTTHERAAGVDATGTIASSGVFFSVFERTGAVGATGAITAAGQRDLLRAVVVTAAASLATAGQRDALRQAAVSATGDVAASGVHEAPRSAALDATAAIQTSGQREIQRAAVVDGAANINVSGNAETPAVERAAQLAATAVATVTSTVRVAVGSVSLNGLGTVSTAGQRDVLRSAIVTATANVTVTGSRIGGEPTARITSGAGFGQIVGPTTGGVA